MEEILDKLHIFQNEQLAFKTPVSEFWLTSRFLEEQKTLTLTFEEKLFIFNILYHNEYFQNNELIWN